MQLPILGPSEGIKSAARSDGVLNFKDEGENAEGMPLGQLTLRSTTAPVYPDGRWVTKREALRIAAAWGVDLFES